MGGRESYVTAAFRYSQTALNATYTVRLYYYPFVYAPVKKGDVIGYACINQITVPMRAQEDIEIYATNSTANILIFQDAFSPITERND